MGSGSGSGEGEWVYNHNHNHNTVPTSKLHFMNKTTDMYSWHKPPSVSHIDMYTTPTYYQGLPLCMYVQYA